MNELPLTNNKKAYTILTLSIIFGIVFQLLFYDKQPGLSCTLVIALFYGAFFITFKGTLHKINFYEALLIAFIILTSITFSLYDDQMQMFFNALFAITLITTHTLLVTETNIHRWYQASFLKDLLYGIFCRPVLYIFKPFYFLSTFMDIKVKNGKSSTFLKVLLGLIIATPILVIVLLLLSSADMIFNNMLSGITNIFVNIQFGDFLIRAILALIFTLILFSYLFSLLLKNTYQSNFIVPVQNECLNQADTKKGLDQIIVITVLSLVNLVYLLFTAVQFTYLFGGLSAKLPSNLTYAEYARRGFFELVAVTLINLLILIIIINCTKNSSGIKRVLIKILNSVLVCCTFVMLFSAHFRMSLYENTYGYTYLRLFTHGFMFFILALLIAALIKIWYEKLILLKWYLIITAAAFLVLNFSNINAQIAKNNIEVYHRTGKIDVYYLTNLSAEAVPYTAKFYTEISKKDPDKAEALEAYLKEQKERLEQSGKSWQSFSLSRSEAVKALYKIDLPDKDR